MIEHNLERHAREPSPRASAVLQLRDTERRISEHVGAIKLLEKQAKMLRHELARLPYIRQSGNHETA